MLLSHYLQDYSSFIGLQRQIISPYFPESLTLRSRSEWGRWKLWQQSQWLVLKIKRWGRQRQGSSWGRFLSLQMGSYWTYSACSPNSNLCWLTLPAHKRGQDKRCCDCELVCCTQYFVNIIWFQWANRHFVCLEKLWTLNSPVMKITAQGQKISHNIKRPSL